MRDIQRAQEPPLQNLRHANNDSKAAQSSPQVVPWAVAAAAAPTAAVAPKWEAT